MGQFKRTISGLFRVLAVIGWICTSAQFANAQSESADKLVQDPAIQKILEQARKDYPLPGIVAAVAKPEQPMRIAAAGIRKFQVEAPITIHDQLHLGSCTKAITSTMIARLVEQEILSWDTTIKEGLPKIAAKIHPDYHDVTLDQLTMHFGGVPREAKNWWVRGNTSVSKKREKIVIQSLAAPPKNKPGSKYVYSNLGYMIAGLIAAKKTGKSWERLVKKEVFEELGLETAGFGPPGPKGEIEQPWGHVPLENGQFRALQHDNAPALGPAGTVHMSMNDWARFALAHADLEGNDLLSADSMAELHQPNPKSDYAKGWIVVDRSWGKGSVLSHTGSNTMWKATVWVAPKTKTAYLVATNVGGDAASKALNDVISDMIVLDVQGK